MGPSLKEGFKAIDKKMNTDQLRWFRKKSNFVTKKYTNSQKGGISESSDSCSWKRI